MYAVELYPYNYKHLSERLQNNRKIVIHTILQNPYLFFLIPDNLKDDKEIATIGIELSGYNIRHVSTRLQDDEDLFFLILHRNSWYINYVSERIRNDPNIIKRVIKKNKFIFQSIRSQLKEDKKFIIEIINELNLTLNYISESLLKDFEIIKIAIKKNSFNYFFLPNNIYYNANYLMRLYIINKDISKYYSSSIELQVIDKYNYYCFLYEIRKKNEDNIFHMEDISTYIGEYLFNF